MRRTGYLLQEAWSSLRIHRTSVIISVLTLACTMTSFGIFALLYLNVKQFAGALQNEFQVVVYLAPDASSTTVTGLRRRLKGEPAVATLSYISKQQALEDFHRQFPQEASLLDGLGENPLPASFVVTLAPPFQSPQAVEAFVKRVQAFPGVDEVRYSQAWIDMLAVFVSYLELSALIIGGVLMVATMAIIANTVRLALYARQEEVEILRLIGATGSFIAIPYLLEGAVLGVVGGGLAVMVLKGGFELFKMEISALEWFHGLHTALTFFSPALSVAWVVMGLMLGCASSLLSVYGLMRARRI